MKRFCGRDSKNPFKLIAGLVTHLARADLRQEHPQLSAKVLCWLV